MGVVSFTHRPLYPQGKNPWYPWVRRLGGPYSRCGRGDERNAFFASTGNRNAVVELVA